MSGPRGHVGISSYTSDMWRWPLSGWIQAAISFFVACILAFAVFAYTNDSYFARYAKQFPHDGQIGLAAFVDACKAGTVTLLLVFFISFMVQRVITADRNVTKKGIE
jgi:hypothetical protein